MNDLTYEHISHVLHDIASHMKKVLKALFQIVVLLCLPIFAFLLFNGINKMILQNSPDNLASISSLGYSFVNFLDLHSMILLGALGITFVVWFFTRNIWKN